GKVLAWFCFLQTPRKAAGSTEAARGWGQFARVGQHPAGSHCSPGMNWRALRTLASSSQTWDQLGRLHRTPGKDKATPAQT
ncbi:hypothetical protein LEMLEM_LOCUS12197, partial [Lemmus lemmus]